MDWTVAKCKPARRDTQPFFAKATRLTPSGAIERLRVEAARRLLSESHALVKRIARRCGFGSEETMRRGFPRLLANTPQDYLDSRFEICPCPAGDDRSEPSGLAIGATATLTDDA